MKGSFLLSILLLFSVLLDAQEDLTLITDRPDQTESAVVVPSWRLQIETGILHKWVEKTDNSFINNTSYGTTMLRFGFFDFMEFRLGSDFMNHRYKLPGDAEQSEFGMSPLGLGLKFALVEENGLIPDIAFISSWNVPNTGHEFYASDRWHHSYVFALAHTLTERWGLGYNLGYEFEGNFEHSSFKYSLVGGYSVAEKLGTFIEIYGSKASGVNLDLRYDMGLTYLLFDNFQLDLSGGIGLTDISPDGFISAGFSWRIPR